MRPARRKTPQVSTPLPLGHAARRQRRTRLRLASGTTLYTALSRNSLRGRPPQAKRPVPKGHKKRRVRTPVRTLRLSVGGRLLDLLELDVFGLRRVAGGGTRTGARLCSGSTRSGVGIGVGIRTALRLLLGVDVLRSGLPCGVRARVMAVSMAAMTSAFLCASFSLAERSLDGGLLVGGQLVAVLLELLLGSEDDSSRRR